MTNKELIMQLQTSQTELDQSDIVALYVLLAHATGKIADLANHISNGFGLAVYGVDSERG